ncbi:hypothetical protein [Piscirickettsia litoralis]|uniref:Uncharacterized protein n=1 Tax=Piscirickettsia litoralis TaxID=1891921 RepID=A0ABX3A1Q4_9GAMM|nr:hypothetical protein [Piscirickettsia litoralis]ODN41558.1 hypothetical protein BGC07_15735 [Piscirickettsia litoralis]
MKTTFEQVTDALLAKAQALFAGVEVNVRIADDAIYFPTAQHHPVKQPTVFLALGNAKRLEKRDFGAVNFNVIWSFVILVPHSNNIAKAYQTAARAAYILLAGVEDFQPENKNVGCFEMLNMELIQTDPMQGIACYQVDAQAPVCFCFDDAEEGEIPKLVLASFSPEIGVPHKEDYQTL